MPILPNQNLLLSKNIIYNSPNMKTTKVSFDRWVNEEDVEYNIYTCTYMYI